MRRLALISIAIIIAILTVGCEDIIKSTFYGSIIVAANNVSKGDEITFKIGPFNFSGVADVSSETTINGKNIVKSITYYIDGEMITCSYDSSNEYSVTYTVKDLSVGGHEVTATCTPNHRRNEIEEHISPAKINVIR